MNDRNKNNDERYRGKRYICLVRQSDDSEGTTSTQAQLIWLHREGERLGMFHVDDVILNGVTGSRPGKRKDLDGLLRRKRERDDFDVLLVQKMDRLTRGGTKHGFWFEYECDQIGIEVLYPGDDMPQDERYSGIYKVLKLEAAKEHARSISQRSVQGAMFSLDHGRNCVVSRTPYGCDRLYFGRDGQPLFIIRNLGDGRQSKLNPETGAVIDTLGSAGGGVKGHYDKQKEEGIRFVPGAPSQVETVRQIFELHYAQRLGGKRIADLLNRQGVLSPMGKGWSQGQVESIYNNPVYCGAALGQRLSQGIYHRRGEDHPEALNLDPQVLANCVSAPRQLRPPQDWRWQDQPAMMGFLHEATREKALVEIKRLLIERWERSQDPTRPIRPTTDKTSMYVLTDLLVAKQDGALMTGVLCGRVGRKVRYYRHRRGNVGYLKGSIYNRLVQAEPVEAAVMDLVRQIIADAPALRERILEQARLQAASASPPAELDRLHDEYGKVVARLRLLAQTFEEDTLDAIKPELDRLAAQRRELQEQIDGAERAQQQTAEDPQTLADRVLQRLATLKVDDLSPAATRELLASFVGRVEVDLETKDVEVHLRLPPWALGEAGPLPGAGAGAIAGQEAMRLANSSRSLTSCQTHRLAGMALAVANCRYNHGPRDVCYRCRRRAAAA